MAVVSFLRLSELEGAKRIDAEYYQPEYAESVKKIALSQKDWYGNIRCLACKVVSGPFGSSLKSESYLSRGIPFIRIQNLEDFFITKEELVYISNKDNERLKSSQLEIGDLVLSKVGNTIGVVSIITDDIGNCNISENNIGIKFPAWADFKLKVFILTFLNSTLGQNQILRRISGNAQPKLNVRDIYDVILYPPSGDLLDQTNDLVSKSKVLIDLAKSFYSQAENLLLEELGLKDFKATYELSYTANLSKAFGVHRIDAEYFQPVYDSILTYLTKNFRTAKLKNIVSFLNHGKQPYYVEDGEIPVLIQKHLGTQHLNLDALDDRDTPRTDREFVDKFPEYKLQLGDVLFYSVGAYLGRTNVLLDAIEAVPASFIALIRAQKGICDPTCLAIFLNSRIGQLQSERRKSASAQQYIYPKDIAEFIIPIFPEETQQKIASLVQQSHEARKKAKELLEEAKRKVEEAIEREIV